MLELADRPSPEPAAGQLAVRVLACGINYLDGLIIEDKYQTRPERPFAPGSEVSGEVRKVGQGVSGWRPGDRLMAFTGHGGLAEEIVIDAARAVQLPEGCDPVAAAGLVLTYSTALHALADRARLQSGETLLVLGAAGGVGYAAIQIGKALGARVVAAVSNHEKSAAARRAGADETLIYERAPFSKTQAKALSAAIKQPTGPNGYDVIFDPVGGDYCEPALRAIAWQGRYLVVGFAAGIANPPLNLALLNSCDIQGVFWGALVERDPIANAVLAQRLLAWWDAGTIDPHIDRTYPLADAGEAIASLANRKAIGKIVVIVAPELAGSNRLR